MSKFKRDFDHAKNKVAGEVKEAVGGITGNEELKLKGKIQSLKADVKSNLNFGDRLKDKKQDIAGSINDKIDGKKTKK